MDVSEERPVRRRPWFSLILPLYNEADGAREIVDELATAFDRAELLYEIVLVNNGSTDETASVLREIRASYESIRVVNIQLNEGYGWGIICGLREARGDILGFMCGDGQIDSIDVVRVCRRLLDEEVDLCKVVRVTRHDGFKRLLMSSCYNFLFRLLFQVKYRDINGTPKLMRRWCYEQLGLVSKDWFIDAEIMIKAAKNGFRIGEVEVAFKARGRGTSNVRLTTSFEFVRNMLRHRFLQEYQAGKCEAGCDRG